jgi:hypothetical protein
LNLLSECEGGLVSRGSNHGIGTLGRKEDKDKVNEAWVSQTAKWVYELKMIIGLVFYLKLNNMRFNICWFLFLLK